MEEILPGLTEDQIMEWKQQYGSVYVSEFDEGTFVWRLLARPEYKAITTAEGMSVFDREEEICKACVLYPADCDFEGFLAGIPSLLAEQIMDKSGFAAKKAPKKL